VAMVCAWAATTKIGNAIACMASRADTVKESCAR